MAQGQLKRALGKGFAIAACVGTIIGLGILRTPGEIAGTVHDPVLYMALWAGGGVFVLLSTLVVAELIGLAPRSGGPYVLIRKAYGPFPGFLLGWTDWAANCAACALKAVVLMEFAALLFPSLRPWAVPGALAINTGFAVLQLGGVRLSGGVLQGAAAVFALILVGLSAALPFGQPVPVEPIEQTASVILHAGPTWAHWGVVAAGIVFTYDGWIAASYYSGEVAGGARSVAVGSIRGVLIVIALYLLLNGLLVASVPLEVLEGQELALAAAFEALYGAGGATVVILVALFILLAHQNVQYMAASRVLYALSVDGLASRRAARVSERGTPSGAVAVTWLLMSILIVVGGFELLLNLCALLFMVGYVAMVFGVFRLRWREPDQDRPYRAWGFPLTGLVCGVGWVAVAIFVALMDPRSAAYSVALAAGSVPVYLWLKARRGL